MKQYEIKSYETKAGKVPFQDWLDRIKDQTVKRKIYKKIRMASFGHFGDAKNIKGAKGLYEMREHYGAGYRIYYSVIGGEIILLLAGSSKRDQDRVIEQSKNYLEDYARRNNHD